MQGVIRLENVTKRFGSETALDRVSLEVPPGVVFALLGENGAGKTTAIRIMLGLADPNSGRAEVLGLASASRGIEIRRRVGYVSERPVLYEWMTVAEIGWFTAGFYGDGFLTEYRRLVAGFGLPERRKIKSLSRGMRAKVSLALALAHDPQLLVLDEPTSGLDALVRREFLESMVDRAATGKTVFLSSHQIAEVERVADVVAILREGRLMVVEPLDALKSQIREVTLTLRDGQAPPDLPGEILAVRRRPRQWQALVRGAGEKDLSALGGHGAVREIEVRAPNLEEIFVAYIERGRTASGGGASNDGVSQQTEVPTP
jgi:ABC-2 type transport system ATP-binding protein